MQLLYLTCKRASSQKGQICDIFIKSMTLKHNFPGFKIISHHFTMFLSYDETKWLPAGWSYHTDMDLVDQSF